MNDSKKTKDQLRMAKMEAAALAEGTGDDPFLERIEDFKTKINEISGNIENNNALINSATVDVLFYLSENP